MDNSFEKQALDAIDKIEALEADIKLLLKAGTLMMINLGYSDDSFARGYISIWKESVKELSVNNNG